MFIAENVVLHNDGRYNTCKGGITIYIFSHYKQCLLELFAEWLTVMLKAKNYDGMMLGIQISYTYENGTLIIKYFGFSDTVANLIGTLADDIRTVFNIKEKAYILFDMIRFMTLSELQNFFLGNSTEIIQDMHSRLVRGLRPKSIEEDMKYLEKLSFEQFQGEMEKFWSQARTEWVAVGNFS